MAIHEEDLADIATEREMMFSIEHADTKSEVHIKQPWRHVRFDEWKMNVETDGSSADAILELDWDSTHRQWDEEYEVWVMDLPSLYEVIEHLSSAGFAVTIEKDVFNAYHDVLD